MYKIIFYFSIILLLVSCSNSGYLRTNDTNKVQSITNANQVEVYSVSSIGKDYEIIGEVFASADAGENAEKPVKILKEKAAAIGADAIINLRLEFHEGYWSTGIRSIGTAVKYK